jgi:hypothetical protein
MWSLAKNHHDLVQNFSPFTSLNLLYGVVHLLFTTQAFLVVLGSSVA